MRTAALRALTAWLLSVLILSPALAQERDERRDEDKAKKEAKRLLFQGDAAFAKKDYKAALQKYQQAYEAYDSPKIFYPMAQTEEKLGLDLEAIHHYEQLLEEAGREISAELRAEARDRISQIEQKLALVRLDLKPEGVRVIIDDIERDTSRPVRLKPGNHTYALELEGYVTVTGKVELKAGSKELIARELKPDGSGRKPSPRPKPRVAGPKTGRGKPPPAVEEPAPPPAPQGKSGAARPVMVASIVATATLGAATCVTGILAVQKHGIYSDETKPLSAREKARDKGKTYALVTDLLLVGTVASAAFTTYWYFYVVKPEREWAAGGGMARTPSVTPWVSTEGGGLLLEGSF